MAGTNRITIVIDADGRAYIEAIEKADRKTEGLTENLKKHWLVASAAIYAAIRTIQGAWNFAEQSAQFDEQRQSLNRLASQYNTTADAIIAAIQRAAGGTISKLEAIGVANKGLMMELDPSQLERFTYAAKRLSDSLGGDTAQAFERLTQATAAGQERALKQLGILVDLQAEYKKYGRELSEGERVTANFDAVSAVLDKTIARLGPDIDTAADAMARFKATIKDFGLIVGNALITATSFVGGGLMWLSYEFAKLVGNITDTLSTIISLGEKLPWVGDKFKDAAAALKSFSQFEQSAAEEAKRMGTGAFEVGTAIWKETEAVKGAIGPLKNYGAAKNNLGNIALGTGSLVRNLEDSLKPLLEQAESKAIHLQVPLVLDWRLLAEASALDAEIDAARAKADQAMAVTAAARLSSMGPPPVVITAGQTSAELSEMAAMGRSLAALQEYYGDRAQLLIPAGASEVAALENMNALKLASDQQTDQMRIASATAAANMMANTMQSLFVATGSKSKELFLAYKAFAVGQAVVSAFLASAKALAYIPPPFNLAASKLVLAMGLANAAAIGAQEMTGSAGASQSLGGGGSISTGSPAPSAYPTATAAEAKPAQNIMLIVHALNPEQVNWDKLMEDNIAPALERYSGSGNNYLDINVRHD